MSVTTISPQELSKSMRGADGIELIDVRTPVEFHEVHVRGARNVPLDRLSPVEVQNERNGTADEPLYVICRSGNRSTKACEQFIAAGYTNVVNVEGGTQAWTEIRRSIFRGEADSHSSNCWW